MMATLNEILADAQHGKAMAELSREFGLTQQQTEAAVAALLPAMSMGLKRSTATPEGLGNLFGVMGQQPDLYAMYDDPKSAMSQEGRVAGNEVLSAMFGSPEASRAIADQAQQFSGVTSGILKKLLPVLAGILISGLMRSGSGQAKPSAPETAPEQGGDILGDILRQVFGQGTMQSPSPSGGQNFDIPPIGDILGTERGAPKAPSPVEQTRAPGGDPIPMPTPADPGGQANPGGDLLGQILRELGKGIQEGRIKPVIVGPYEIDIPGQTGPASQDKPPTPGAEIFGQILRDLLGGAGNQAQLPRQGQPTALMDGVGAAVFGDRLEAGRDFDQNQLDSLQKVFDRFLDTQRR